MTPKKTTITPRKSEYDIATDLEQEQDPEAKAKIKEDLIRTLGDHVLKVWIANGMFPATRRQALRSLDLRHLLKRVEISPEKILEYMLTRGLKFDRRGKLKYETNRKGVLKFVEEERQRARQKMLTIIDSDEQGQPRSKSKRIETETHVGRMERYRDGKIIGRIWPTTEPEHGHGGATLKVISHTDGTRELRKTDQVDSAISDIIIQHGWPIVETSTRDTDDMWYESYTGGCTCPIDEMFNAALTWFEENLKNSEQENS